MGDVVDSMSLANFPKGHAGFAETIGVVSDALGGEAMHKAVSSVFVEALYAAMHRRIQGRFIPSGLAWTSAIANDFDAATSAALASLQTSPDPIEKEAILGGCVLRVRGLSAYLEADDYRLELIRASGSDSSGRWTIFVTKSGEHVLDALPARRHTSSPKTSHAGSRGSALRSLVRMAEIHFGVVLQDAPQEAPHL